MATVQMSEVSVSAGPTSPTVQLSTVTVTSGVTAGAWVMRGGILRTLTYAGWPRRKGTP